jgi:hypothetical protein
MFASEIRRKRALHMRHDTYGLWRLDGVFVRIDVIGRTPIAEAADNPKILGDCAAVATVEFPMILKRGFLALLLTVTFFGSPSVAVEEPAFRTVLSDGGFEVRDYPGLIVAEVTVTGERKEAANKGFRLLAGYIFGGNKRRQSIAMTAPVAQAPVHEKIAMTAPVTQIQQGGTWIVRFTMPSA